MSKINMIKLGLSCAAILSSVAVAGDCSIKSGAYAGISAGIAQLSGKNSVQHSDTAAVQQFYNYGSTSATSFAGSVFAGYGMKFGCMWAGAELFYQFDNFQNKRRFDALTANVDKIITIKSNGAYGANAHFGVFANNMSVVYLIAGVESRRFNVKYVDLHNDIAASGQPKKSYTSLAFVPGLGVKLGISKNLSVRTEYKYALHKDKKIVGAKAGTETISIKNTPKVHSFQVGLAYTF